MILDYIDKTYSTKLCKCDSTAVNYNEALNLFVIYLIVSFTSVTRNFQFTRDDKVKILQNRYNHNLHEKSSLLQSARRII